MGNISGHDKSGENKLDHLIAGADLIVVGAGFYGSTMAETTARILNKKVLVIDKRAHIGGNAFTFEEKQTGIEVHKYGAHIFHTSNVAIWTYLNRFGSFDPYELRVLTLYKGGYYSMPIGLATISQFYGQAHTPESAKRLLEEEAAKFTGLDPTNFEDKAISQIGRPLYDAFIRGYTAKQWQTDPRQLPAEIFTRLPVRHNFDTRYFSDTYQGIPQKGYTSIIQNMLNHNNIAVALNTDFMDVKARIPAGKPIVYTGPIDQYFDHKFGRLGWRTLDFEEQVHDVPDFQGTSVINIRMNWYHIQGKSSTDILSLRAPTL